MQEVVGVLYYLFNHDALNFAHSRLQIVEVLSADSTPIRAMCKYKRNQIAFIGLGQPNQYNRVMSKITPGEIRRIAELANIGLNDNEVNHYTAEINQIVGFVEQLQKADVESVPPTDQVTGLVDVWREDEVKPGLSHGQLKLNAPAWENDQYKVKRVLND